MKLEFFVGIIPEQSPLAIDLYTQASELKFISVSHIHIATIRDSYHNTAPHSLVSNNVDRPARVVERIYCM